MYLLTYVLYFSTVGFHSGQKTYPAGISYSSVAYSSVLPCWLFPLFVPCLKPWFQKVLCSTLLSDRRSASIVRNQMVDHASWTSVRLACRARQHHYLQLDVEPEDQQETLSPGSLQRRLLWSSAATGRICGLLPTGKSCCTSALSRPETV